MTATTKLTQVRAGDLMQTDLVRLSADTPVDEAVRTFEEYHIRGAPVVDSAGKLIGVLSVADITGNLRECRIDRESDRYDLGHVAFSDDEDTTFDPDGYSAELAGKTVVGDCMQADVVTVPPNATLREVCTVMSRASIHRVLVSEDGVLKGLVSTFDVVRLLASELC